MLSVPSDVPIQLNMDVQLPLFFSAGRTSVSAAPAAPPFGSNNVKTNFLSSPKPASNGAVRYEHNSVQRKSFTA